MIGKMMLMFTIGFFSYYLIFSIFVSIAIKIRKKHVVLVNFEELVDLTDIRTRAKIYCANRDDVKECDYIGTHISEQKVIPKKILKMLRLQDKQYTMIYYSAMRNESLRIQTAKVLNDWGLKGELHLISDWQTQNTFKSWLFLKVLEKGFKIKYVYDTDKFMRNHCRLLGVKVL